MLHPAQLCRAKNSHKWKIRENLCIHCEYYIVRWLKAISNWYLDAQNAMNKSAGIVDPNPNKSIKYCDEKSDANRF